MSEFIVFLDDMHGRRIHERTDDPTWTLANRVAYGVMTSKQLDAVEIISLDGPTCHQDAKDLAARIKKAEEVRLDWRKFSNRVKKGKIEIAQATSTIELLRRLHPEETYDLDKQ